MAHTLVYESEFPFRAPNGIQCNCLVRVFRDGGSAVVEWSESYHPGLGVTNPGASITNCADTLKTLVHKRLGAGPLKDATEVRYLERYDEVEGPRYAWFDGHGVFKHAPTDDVFALLPY